MTDNKRKYWGIKNNGEILFTGTFKECWNDFVKRYANKTMGELDEMNVLIERVA